MRVAEGDAHVVDFEYAGIAEEGMRRRVWGGGVFGVEFAHASELCT